MMPAKSAQESRRYPRRSAEWPVLIQYRRELEEARTQNVSHGGIFIETPIPVKHNELIFFRVFTGKNWVSLSGRVIHHAELGLGIELFGVGRYDQSLWDEAVMQLRS